MKRLILSLFLFVQAVQIVCAWNGSIATSYAGGDGSQSNPYQIATAEQLALLAHNVNDEGITYSGQYFILTNDIDLFGLNGTDTIQWTPIGKAVPGALADQDGGAHTFAGRFDGQNHTVSNLFIRDSINGDAGLFGRVGHCRIKNIRMNNVFVYAQGGLGAVCGSAAYDTQIDNCHVLSGTIILPYGRTYAGGVIGHMKTYYRIYYDSRNWSYVEYIGRVSNCTNRANINSFGVHDNMFGLGVGGIVGFMTCYNSQSCGHIEDCVNYGEIVSVGCAGGICGGIHATYTISLDSVLIDNCHNYGNVTPSAQSVNSEAGRLGGIVGRMESGGTIQNCTNAGSIPYRPYEHYYNRDAVGGIVGNVYNGGRVRNCVNTGWIYQTVYSGGICGYSSGSIVNCLNAGRVGGIRYSGGIAGYMSSMSNCISVNANSATQDKGQIAGTNGRNASNCYFDKQCLLTAYAGWGTYENANSDSWGRFTTEMVGNGLQGSLQSSGWVFEEGMYPRPVGVENTPIAIVAATPVYLHCYNDTTYDELGNVSYGMELGTLNGVTWTSDCPIQISGTHVAVTDTMPSGEYYRLYAHLGEAQKLIEFDVRVFNPDTVLPIDTTVIPIDTIVNPIDTTIINPFDTTIVNPIDTTVNPVDTTHVTPTPRPTNGNFTINAQGERVIFSPGNLQYQASTNTWRFAEHQYDYVGDATRGNVYQGSMKCDNAQISSTYSGWIDMFRWGTSGWNNGSNAYMPYSTNYGSNDYIPFGIYDERYHNLTGIYANSDWGIYNQIGNDAPGTWRTPTYDEWNYIFSLRPNAANLRGQASIVTQTETINGYILFPDSFVMPQGLTFVSKQQQGHDLYYETNVYSLEDWSRLENAGAVFLPASGYIYERVEYLMDHGFYWSSSCRRPVDSGDAAHSLSFCGTWDQVGYDYWDGGRSVRLISNNNATVVPPPTGEPKAGYFSVSDSLTVRFAPGNLQYQASTDTWRFAEHQYDYVGSTVENKGYGTVYENGVKSDNAQASATYSGWIDMYNYGTSGWNSGANLYMPYNSSGNSNDFRPDGVNDYYMTGNYANADWGVYNQIGEDLPGTWRTPTNAEWEYLLNTRQNAQNLRAQAEIMTDSTLVRGYILLPDSFTMPSHLIMVFGEQIGYPANRYSLSDWAYLEHEGAIFLPASGIWTDYYTYFNECGYYWGSTASCIYFDKDWMYTRWASYSFKEPVRLIYVGLPNDTIAPPDTTEVIVPTSGRFTINAQGERVVFAPGNMQYQASPGTHLCADGTTQQGVWRFAEHQWDYVGDATNGTVYWNGAKCNNENISSTYSGWIDLFGWGTSGWNSGANAYQPYDISTTASDYYPGGTAESMLTDRFAYADWAVYNQIGEDAPGTWRTLSADEWAYLLDTRNNSANLKGRATVNNVKGCVFLPDDWTVPTGLSFIPGTSGYETNVYSASQWEQMEAAGAIFLPVAGYRQSTAMFDLDAFGYCWSTTPYSTTGAYEFSFSAENTNMYNGYRYRGRSLRPAKTVDTVLNPVDTTHVEPIPVPAAGSFTINAQGERIVFAPANLLYNAAQGSHLCADGTTHPGTWRFADHQWDYVGDAYNGTVYWNGTKCNNENISSTYDGWIDLFGFGTSGWNSGANEYQPYASSSSSTDYYVGGGETNSLVGSYAYADWGIFNTIESYPCGTWRTLTLDEWDYLFTSRTDASMKYGQATVNNVAGFILLPDEWVIPAGLTFTPGPAIGYGANTYSLSEWEQMEQAGAVFLPAGGYRQGRSMQSVQANGDYYFSTANSYDATRFYFTSSSSSYSSFSGERYFGRALRLVRTPSATPVVDPVYFSFSDSICAGETYAWEGSKFTEAGEYTKTLVSSLGGDSIVTLHLYSYSCEEVYEDVPFCYEERGMEAVLTIIDGENVNYQWEQKVNGEWQVLSAGYLSQTIQLPTSTTDTIYLRFVGSELLSNLIVNGDFEAGNTGFETGYTYDSLAIYTEGTYTVTNDVNLVHADAQCAEDHTTGEGMMMAINGGSNANANVWTQTVTGLLPNTDYAFSAWAALWTDYGFNYPELEFSINGELQGQRFSPNEGTCNWTQLYTIWNSGNHTSAQIRLVDQQIGEMANDFCIDDIYFSPLLGRLDGAIKYLKVYLLQPIDTTIVYRTINEGDTCSWEGDIYTTAGNYVKTFVSAEGCDSLVMLQLTVVDPLPEDQAFYFSTSDTTAVFFSPGNLQYKATPGTHLCADGTMQQGVWRFAEHQWSYVGTQNDRFARSYNVARQHGNVYENGVICDNANVSSTYSGWIDLFAYGTSGWNSGVAKYQPWTVSLSDDVYLIESYWSQYFHFGDLTGEYAYADWGVYNQIGEYAPGTWRTPTHDEWIYIVSQRPHADSLRGIGMIDGVPGFILLPDNSRWDSLPFNPGLIEYADMNWSIVSNNTIDYAINPYTSAQWEQMEAAGAIFLPAAGDRFLDFDITVYYSHWDPNTYTDVFKQRGYYMSSSLLSPACDGCPPTVRVLDFDPYLWSRNYGNSVGASCVSVRLIRDCRTCNPQDDLPTPITAPVSAAPQKAKIILQDNTIYILLPDGTRFDALGRKVK